LSSTHAYLGSECGSTFVNKAFLQWLEPRLIAVKRESAGAVTEREVRLISRDVKTGGHSTLEPLGKLMSDRFEVVKHRFDDIENTNIQLPSKFPDKENQGWGLETLDKFKDQICDGVINLSR